MYYKIISDETVVSFGIQSSLPKVGVEITKDEYTILLNAFNYHSELLDTYIKKVISGEIKISEIENEEDRDEVQRRISYIPENPYGISDETYNNITDDYTSSITEEVASNGY